MGSIDGANHCPSTVGGPEKLLSGPSEKLRICVAGAAGPMGSAICQLLKRQGHYVIACDWRKDELKGLCVFWDEFHVVDLTVMDDCLKMTRTVDHVFNFATSTRGLGFSEFSLSLTKDNDTTIGNNMAEAVRINGVQRYFHASIAYVDAELRQLEAVAPLAEQQYPIGFEKPEKPETEVLIERYHKDFGMECRIGRFHCIYGLSGTWEGGRGKASTDKFGMLGDGPHTSYAEDVLRLMKSDCREPVYIGNLNMRDLVILGSDHHKKLACAGVLKNWLRMLCFWIKERTDSSTDGSAEVVGTEAPVQRTADGKE